jgi:hypothetical protein
MACLHDGFHSAVGRYDAEAERLTYVMVCDACGEDLRDILVERYRPAPILDGGDAPLRAAA